MSDDPFDDPQWQEYARQAREKLEPMVRDSAVAVSIYTGEVDPKMAIETGYMILLDKPIIAVVDPNAKMPKKLALVADAIVEGPIDDPSFSRRLNAAMSKIMGRESD